MSKSMRVIMALGLLLLASGAGATCYTGGAYDGYDFVVAAGGAGLPQITHLEGATNITSSSAVLNGMLLHTGAAPAQVFLYWGLEDGGEVAGAWEHCHEFGFVTAMVPLMLEVSLLPEAVYYYRFFVSNSVNQVAWSYPGATMFLTMAPPVVGVGDGVVFGRTSAVLNGELIAGKEAEMTIFWGKSSDAWSSTNSMGWRSVVGTEVLPNPFYLLVDGLQPETTYGYMVRAENLYGVDESTPIWFTTGTDHFIEQADYGWFGGGSFDGYDNTIIATEMPGFNGTVLMLR